MPAAWIPWYPLRVYPKYPERLDTKVYPAEVPLMPVSPYFDEMMMTNVRQFQIPRFQMTNVFKQNFGTELTTSAQSFATCFQAVGYSERDQLTITHNHLSEDALKPRPFSSFLCASS